MARAGEAPSPAFERGNELPYGVAAAANRGVTGLVAQEPPLPPEEPFKPANPQEAFLFSPTDRPGEPATHGAPIGPGADYTPHTYESDQEFLARVAGELDTPDASREVRDFVRRVRQGL
jgi:hypothetical protein